MDTRISELREAVLKGDINQVENLLKSGVPAGQRYTSTFGQQFLSEKALLNRFEEIAKLLLNNRVCSEEEELRILEAAVRISSLEWVLTYIRDSIPRIRMVQEFSVKYNSPIIFKHFLKTVPTGELFDLTQQWYHLALQKCEKKSIQMIFEETSIAPSILICSKMLKYKVNINQIIQGLLDCEMEIDDPQVWRKLVQFPRLIILIAQHPRNLIDSPSFWPTVLSQPPNSQIYASISIFLIYGSVYPPTNSLIHGSINESIDESSYFENISKLLPEYAGCLLFFELIRKHGSLGLPYLWPKLQIKKLVQKFNYSQNYLRFSKLDVSMKELIGSLNLVPFLISIDYLLYQREEASPQQVRKILLEKYNRIFSKRSFENLNIFDPDDSIIYNISGIISEKTLLNYQQTPNLKSFEQSYQRITQILGKDDSENNC